MTYAKPIVSIFTTRWGHLSIGEAVKDSLNEARYKIFFNNIPVEKVSEFAYMPMYKFFPSVSGITFKASEQKRLSELVVNFLHKRYQKNIENYIQVQRPNVVVNTYFGFNHTLELLSKKLNFLYINVVADPRTINKLLVSKIGYNFVFDKESRDICLEYGVKENKIITSGWFVRKSFYQVQNLTKLKDKLNISNTDLIVLIVGGSWGNYSILKSLPAFINLEKKVSVVFIAGESKTLQKSAEVFSNLFKSKNLKITTLEFTKNLDEYIKVSDVVIGKAGPNLLFETVAAKKPFVAVSHIHGQEDGNLEIIKNYKLGLAEENPIKVVKLLRAVLKHPEKLEQFNKPIRILSNYNQTAEKVLIELIQSKLPQASHFKNTDL